MAIKLTVAWVGDVEFNISDRVRRKIGRYAAEGVGEIVSIKSEVVAVGNSFYNLHMVEVNWGAYKSIFNIRDDGSVCPLIQVEATVMKDNPNYTFRNE